MVLYLTIQICSALELVTRCEPSIYHVGADVATALLRLVYSCLKESGFVNLVLNVWCILLNVSAMFGVYC